MSEIRPEYFQQVVLTRLDKHDAQIREIHEMQIKLGNALIDYIRLTKDQSKEILQLVDDLSWVHGKVVALKD